MKIDKNVEKYGTITYEESFWTGKKTLYLEGKELEKYSKNVFIYKDCGGKEIEIITKGNVYTGLSLMIDNELIELSPKLKWYEIIFSLLPFILIMIWGNVPSLCAIIPIVGGAIGGIVGAIATLLTGAFIRKTDNILFKFLISLIVVAVSFLICFIIALLILNLFAA